MFALAILIGIYSYLIFILGILGLLNRDYVLFSTIVFIGLTTVYFKKNKKDIPKVNLRKKSIRPFLILFFAMAAINFVGALGPELSFDALWYHLTIPKIFIQESKIFYIPGGLFYYSLMPKLGEMLFIPGLMFGNEIIAKLIQWIFGILTSLAVYKLSREFFNDKISALASLIFYSSLVVSWESTIAYVDLVRAFFEVLAFWGFVLFLKTKEKKWLVESSIMLGLAISTKINSIATIIIFISLIALSDRTLKTNLKQTMSNILIYCTLPILVAFPWFFFSYLQSSNPVFPFFSQHFKDLETGILSATLLNPINIVQSFYDLFLKSADPITPIYLAFIPILILNFKKISKNIHPLIAYSLLALILWYPFANIGGSRFILPYLPVFSVIAAGSITLIKNEYMRNYLIFFIVIVCLMTAFYRGIANSRYLPVILGSESKDEFLVKNLNFGFGDFYDTEGFFRKNLESSDKVLILGFHNLFYADFPFYHESFVKMGDNFNYIVSQGDSLPSRFSSWEVVHSDVRANFKVYSLKGVK